MIRKGLGKNQGKGYKNMVVKDPMVHSMSAKGIKSQVRMNNPIKPLNRLSKFSKDFDITNDELKQIELETSSKIKEIEEWYDEKDFLLIKMEDGTSWVISSSEDDAKRLAEDRVREDLENEPELFSQDWLQNYITMTDTDRRIIANEESDYIVDEMSDDEILDESEKRDDYDELQEEIDELMEKEDIDENIKTDKISELESKQEKIIDDGIEELMSDKYDKIYNELDDPIDYFVEERGIYTIKELMKQSFITININEATEDAVSDDGWAHFLSRYDGDYIELKGGKVMWRED